MCTVPAEIVAGPAAIASVTGSPDDAPAPIVKSASPNVLFGSGPKSIVWLALATTSSTGADALGTEVSSPSYDAVIACVPAASALVVYRACPLASSTAVKELPAS